MIDWTTNKIEIGKLDATFYNNVSAALTPGPYLWRIVFGFRSNLAQQILYEKYLKGGALAAPPGQSAHNYGLAVDVVLVINGVEQWNYLHPGWSWLWLVVLKSSGLHSGKVFNDPDHIQAVNWRLKRHAA